MDREEAAETPGPQVKGQRDTVAWIRESGNRGGQGRPQVHV